MASLRYLIVVVSVLLSAPWVESKEWLSEPGTIRVLQGTTANFNWSHRYPTSLETSWIDRGPDDSSLDMIMINSDSGLFTYGIKRARLDYNPDAGNAAMIIKRVTSSDSGYYVAKVILSEKKYIESKAQLLVHPASDASYELTSNNQTYKLNANTKPQYLSSALLVHPGDIYNFRIRPVSQDIKIRATAILNGCCGRPVLDQCPDTSLCNLKVVVKEQQLSESNLQNASILIKVDLLMQGVPSTSVMQNITFVLPQTTKQNSVLASSIGSIIAVLVVVAIVIGVFFYIRKQRKKKLFTYRDESTGLLYRSKSNVRLVEKKAHDPNLVQMMMLNSMVIPVEYLKIPEYFFSTKFDFLCDVFCPTCVDSMDNITRCVTALLNSSGGVIHIAPKNACSSDDVEKWSSIYGQFILDNGYISRAVLKACVDLQCSKAYVLILVRKSTRLSTFSYNIMIPIDDKPQRVRENKSIADVFSTKQERKYDTLQFQTLSYKLKADFSDNEKTKHLHHELTSSQELSAVLQSDASFLKILRSLPNEVGGGLLILGINHLQTVQGYKSKQVDEQKIKKMIKDVYTNKSCVWGTEDKTAKESIEWSVTFIPINRDKDEKDRILVQVKVSQCPGGFFYHCPECYNVDNDGNIVALGFDAWQKLVSQEKITEDDGYQTYSDEHASNRLMSWLSFHSKSIGSTNSLLTAPKQMYKISTLASVEMSSVLAPSPEIPMIRPLDQTINMDPEDITDLTPRSWYEDQDPNKNQEVYRMFQSVKNIALEFDVLLPQQPIKVTPGVTMFLDGQGSFTDPLLVNVLQEIRKEYHSSRGFALMSKCALANVQSVQNSTTINVPRDHVCDVIFVSGNSSVTIWTVSRKKNFEAQRYGFQIGRLIKRKLVEHLYVAKAVTLDKVKDYSYFIQTVLCYNDDNEELQMQKFCAYEAELEKNVFRRDPVTAITGVQETLAWNLGRNKVFTSRVAQEVPWQLSSEQVECVLTADISKISVLEGISGSGKSHIATSLCIQKGTNIIQEDILYIVTTQSLKVAILRNDNLSVECLVIKKGDDLLVAIHNNKFEKFKFIIIDGAENIKLSKNSSVWEEMFSYCLSAQIQLCITLDPFAVSGKNEHSSLLLQRCVNEYGNSGCVSRKRLSMNYRNSRKVYGFIFHNLHMIRDEIKPANTMIGEDVMLQFIPNIKLNHKNNGLIKLVQSLIEEEDSTKGGSVEVQTSQFHPTEIAILVDTFGTVDTKEYAHHIRTLLKKFFPDMLLSTAADYPTQGLVVDSLDNFVGMDARSVICITPLLPRNVLADFGYKYNVASRGVDKVIFVQREPITQETWDVFSKLETEEEESDRQRPPDSETKLSRWAWSLLHGELSEIQEHQKGLDFLGQDAILDTLKEALLKHCGYIKDDVTQCPDEDRKSAMAVYKHEFDQGLARVVKNVQTAFPDVKTDIHQVGSDIFRKEIISENRGQILKKYEDRLVSRQQNSSNPGSRHQSSNSLASRHQSSNSLASQNQSYNSLTTRNLGSNNTSSANSEAGTLYSDTGEV